jgi:hypothetical protein
MGLADKMTALIAAVVFSFVLIGPPQAAAPAIGYVASLNGPWMADHIPVKPGQGLPAGARLRLALTASDTNDDYSIEVTLLNNRPLGCRSTNACRPGVTLPAALNAPAPLASRLTKAFDLIFNTPTRWVGLVSRGVPTEFDLADGVVSVSNGKLSLGTLFATVPPGDYALRLSNESDGQANAPVLVVGVKWTGAPNQPAAPAVPRGLYSVKMTRTGAREVLGREAWWLIVPEAQVVENRAAFAEAVALTKTWSDASPGDIERFLHAFLAALADPSR